MKLQYVLLLAFVVSLEPMQTTAANSTALPHFTAELVPESRTPAPGKHLTTALVINPAKGWHIYWKNPGETGLPPQPEWNLPAGFSAGELQHPVPSALVVDGLISNVHKDKVSLLTDLSVPDALPEGSTIPVGLSVRLAVCTEGQCIPRKIKLDLRLVAGGGNPDPAMTSLFRQARAALPLPLDKPGNYEITASTLRLLLPLSESGDISSAQVFFDGEGTVAHGSQHLIIGIGGLSITMSSKGIPVGLPLSGVVRVMHSGQAAGPGANGYQFIAMPKKNKSGN